MKIKPTYTLTAGRDLMLQPCIASGKKIETVCNGTGLSMRACLHALLTRNGLQTAHVPAWLWLSVSGWLHPIQSIIQRPCPALVNPSGGFRSPPDSLAVPQLLQA